MLCLFWIAVPKKKTEISSGSATIVRSKGPKGLIKSSSQNIEKELSDEEVDDIISGTLSSTIIGEISSANWKERYYMRNWCCFHLMINI